MNSDGKSTSKTYSVPVAQLASFHCLGANVLLYRLYATRFIACSRMSPVEAAYRNAQYELLGIKARWARTHASKVSRAHRGGLWMGGETVHA